MIKIPSACVFSFDLQASKCFMIPSTHSWGNGNNRKWNDLPKVLQKRMAESGTAPTWPENPTISTVMHLSRWDMDCRGDTSVWHCLVKADLQRRQRRSGCTYPPLAQTVLAVYMCKWEDHVWPALIRIIYITVLLTEKLINPQPADDLQTCRHIITNITLSCFFGFVFFPCCGTTEHLVLQQNKLLAKEACLNHSGSPHITDT